MRSVGRMTATVEEWSLLAFLSRYGRIEVCVCDDTRDSRACRGPAPRQLALAARPLLPGLQ